MNDEEFAKLSLLGECFVRQESRRTRYREGPGEGERCCVSCLRKRYGGPSRCDEGAPLAVLEAQAAGIPIVATRSGGIPELVTERTALLVPKEDPQAMAEALDRALALDRNDWGSKKHAACFTLEKCAARIADVIEECVGVKA